MTRRERRETRGGGVMTRRERRETRGGGVMTTIRSTETTTTRLRARFDEKKTLAPSAKLS